ncbi:hypothetical protein HGRIS_010706 [Hohenbuehelia grisea]|uniref:Tat pathway signal sequence n=1 Tax=Hohenbuehelia grisea TaxID=104357 RepID=A0ABR3IXV9_9AGAR
MNSFYKRLGHPELQDCPDTSGEANAWRFTQLARFLAALTVANIALFCVLLYTAWGNLGIDCHTGLVYSPANDAIEHRVLRFTTGFLDDEEITPFASQDYSERDAAWKDLTSVQATLITLEEAQRLTVPTIPMPGNETWYIGGLDVFHQLHCLDLVRRGLGSIISTPGNVSHSRAETATPLKHELDALSPKHLNHCIDSIRQSLMCQGDTSIVSWYQPEGAQKPQPRFDQPHTCRNFEKLREWAATRKPR